MPKRVSAIVSAYYAQDFIESRLVNLQYDMSITPEIVVIGQQGSYELEVAARRRVDVIVSTEGVPTIGAAWNLGIKACSGEYVTTANTDDLFFNNGMEKLMLSLDENPWATVAYGNHHTNLNDRLIEVVRKDTNSHQDLLERCHIGMMPMWRKEIHDKFGYFDEKLIVVGDYEFWLRLSFNGCRFYHLDYPVGFYRNRADSLEHRNPGIHVVERNEVRERYMK